MFGEKLKKRVSGKLKGPVKSSISISTDGQNIQVEIEGGKGWAVNSIANFLLMDHYGKQIAKEILPIMVAKTLITEGADALEMDFEKLDMSGFLKVIMEEGKLSGDVTEAFKRFKERNKK